MPPRENDDMCMLDTEREPGHVSMEEHSSKLRAQSEPAAPAVPVDVEEVKEVESLPTPSGFLQYILCMFVNFIVVSLGINWFLGFFGLALKPLEDLDNQEESDLLKFKEKKRNLEEVSGVDGGQQNMLTKRLKFEEVLRQEKEAEVTEEEDFGIMKKSIGSRDRAKAIAEFQGRLWNMKPDLNFLDVEPKSEVKVQAGLCNKSIEVEDSNNKVIEDDGKDVVKKVITPSKSFDNILNMSEDTSEIPAGDVIEIDNVDEDLLDVEDDDATSGDPINSQNEQYEECREENQVETVAPFEDDFDLVSIVNEFKANLETEPTGSASKDDSRDVPPIDQKIKNSNLSHNHPGEESVAFGVVDRPAPTQVDYPVLVKPDFAVLAKPDYQILEKPDYAVQEKPDYPIQEKPDYAVQEKPDYAVQEKPDYAVQEKPEYAIQEKPDYAIQEKPNYAVQEKPDYAVQEKPVYTITVKPDYAVEKKPDYQVQHKPDYPVIEKPIYQVLEKPEYPVKEKLVYPISEKPYYQVLEQPISETLDSIVEKQDDQHLGTNNDGSDSEELDQLATNQPFLEEQLDEKSKGSFTQIRTVEEHKENEDVASEDDKQETLIMEFYNNTTELVGEENTMAERKSDESLAELSTAEEQTKDENSAVYDDGRTEISTEKACEESISVDVEEKNADEAVDVEEKKSDMADKEGRRGSVGSKGRGGGNKSGSKQKKKKRKIL